MKIFINGAPGTGKSTITKLLAKELGIYTTFGSDTIREILRSNTTPESHPVLHTSAILACDWAPDGQDKMLWGFHEQAKDVKPGIMAILKRAQKEDFSFIIEGIHLYAEFFKQIVEADVFHFTIAVPDPEEYKKRILGQSEDRSSYKLENFEKAVKFQEYLLEQAKTNNSHIINNIDLETSIAEILKIVKK